MNIIVNGNPREVAAALTVALLLEQADTAGRRVAVEINGEIVPRGLHQEHCLNAGDRVEILHAIGGG